MALGNAARWAAVGLALSAAAGCAATGQKAHHSGWSQEQALALRDDLDQFLDRSQAAMDSTADAIRDASSDREVRKAAVLWKVRTTTSLQDAVSLDDPLSALMETWGVCLRVAQYVEQGGGSRLFGDQQKRAVETAAGLVESIETIAGRWLPPHDMAEARQRLTDYAKEHPLEGAFEESDPRAARMDKGFWDGLVSVVSLPLLPFTAPGKIEAGTRRLRTTSDQWAEIVEDLPRETRWQAELLMLHLEDTDTVKRALAAAEQAAQAADRAVGTLEDFEQHLPQHVDRSLAPAAEQAALLADHLAARAAQLLAFAAVLGAALLVLAHALQSRAARANRPG